jgi:hypothetical protein
MDDLLSRIAEGFAARVEGPMHFRMILQPLMATLFAVRDGLKDAKAGRAPWLWGTLSKPDERSDFLRNAWKSIGKVFLIALSLDLVYQAVIYRFKEFHPIGAVLVAVVLALVPYVLLRGPVNRIARMFMGGK